MNSVQGVQRERSIDNAISYIRVIAMFMIILCHFLQYYDNVLAQWFNVGVQIFLVLSGFLYGNKEVDDPIAFLSKQCKKILIPYWLFLIPVIILYFIFSPELISASLAIKAIFCAGRIEGIKHLWFVPYILVCYFLTPYLCWVRRKTENMSLFKASCCYVSVLLLVLLLGVLFDSYFTPDKIVCYFIGFFVSTYYHKYGIKAIKLISLFIVPISFIINVIRAFLNAKQFAFTNSQLYEYFELAAHIALGTALFLVMYALFYLIKVKQNTVVENIGKISYSVYVCHLLFILSPFSLMSITNIVFVNWIIVIIAIFGSAILLNCLTNALKKIIK